MASRKIPNDLVYPIQWTCGILVIIYISSCVFHLHRGRDIVACTRIDLCQAGSLASPASDTAACARLHALSTSRNSLL